ncbi:alkaline phosphatase family protein [Streptomyces sp. NPDC002248]
MPADSTTGPLSSRSPSRRAVLGGAGAVLLGAALPLSPARAAARTPKVLLLGIDGALLGRTAAAGTPHLDSLRASGLTAQSLLYSEPLAPTLSGPGWSTILTGVWPDKHKVRDNNFTGRRFDLYPDFLTRAERYRPALSTYAVASWNPLTTTVFSPEVDTRVSTPEAEYDTGTTQRAVAALRDGNHDAVFVHLDNVDHAGHSYGAASSQYLAALATADAQLGQLLGAVRGRATYAQEDWLLLVTTDHGHTDPGGHGGNTLPERQTFLVASGGGLPAGSVRYDVRMPDVAATALAHLGVPIDPAWGLDGRPLAQSSGDPFDTLRPALGTRVDETGIPAGTLGFTHTAPSGWSVENTGMSGGVTEWRGWSFTTDEFWSAAERGQGRENNVRARNVFAVADGDEWADRSYTGGFDSTLVSPAWAVSAGSVLRYTTYYRQESPQRGEVLVSYDGAAPVSVRTYTADVSSRVETIPLQVPAGARTARVRFRYTAGNNWYWTVDDVAVVRG